jgi:hypothetical protein
LPAFMMSLPEGLYSQIKSEASETCSTVQEVIRLRLESQQDVPIKNALLTRHEAKDLAQYKLLVARAKDFELRCIAPSPILAQKIAVYRERLASAGIIDPATGKIMCE